MAFAVVAYPILTAADHNQVETCRQKHDKLFGVIKPHFTLVFPMEGITAEEFTDAAVSDLSGIKEINFVMRCATLNKDAFSPVYHAFLVVDEGNSSLIKLHDLAYNNSVIGKFHLPEIDYIPHIVIASSADVNKIKTIVSEWNAPGFEIAGKIQSVDLIEIANSQVTTIKKISLI